MSRRVFSVTPPDPIDAYVGRRITYGRKYRAMSPAALAAAVNVPAQQLAKFESGENRVSASMLWKLSRALGTDPNFFFAGLGTDKD